MILALNCAAATVAAAVNVWAAVHRSHALAVLRWIRAGLAAAFAAVCALDIVGVFSFSERVAWGQALALAAWPLVWVLPALVRAPKAPDPEAVVAEVRKQLEAT